MSILKCLVESLYNEGDLDLGGDTADVAIDKEVDVASEEPAPEEKPATEGDPKALVDSLIKYAPGKEKQIKNMLKYAANSGQEYDIFDSAYDYFESIEDTFKEQPAEEELPADDDLGDEELPAPAPEEKAPAPAQAKKQEFNGL